MSFKNNTCPRCASSLSDADFARINRREWIGGTIGGVVGAVLGLLGAALGVYFGTNA